MFYPKAMALITSPHPNKITPTHKKQNETKKQQKKKRTLPPWKKKKKGETK